MAASCEDVNPGTDKRLFLKKLPSSTVKNVTDL
jgi:hypothetical protein